MSQLVVQWISLINVVVATAGSLSLKLDLNWCIVWACANESFSNGFLILYFEIKVLGKNNY